MTHSLTPTAYTKIKLNLKLKSKLLSLIDSLFEKNPPLAYITCIIFLPIFLLLSITIAACVIMLPFALIFSI